MLELLSLDRSRKTSEITKFRRTKYLNSLSCKIAVKSRQSQSRPVDGWFPNLAIETPRGAFESQAQRLRVVRVKVPDGDVRDAMGCGCGHLHLEILAEVELAADGIIEEEVFGSLAFDAALKNKVGTIHDIQGLADVVIGDQNG